MTKAKSMKSSKIIKMLMVCGASIAMLAPIAVSPLNSMIPNNVTANASRVRKPRKHKFSKREEQRIHADRFIRWYEKSSSHKMSAAINKTDKRGFSRIDKAVAQEQAYEKSHKLSIPSVPVQAQLVRLATRARNAGFEESQNRCKVTLKTLKDEDKALLRHKNSKNPYVRKLVRYNLRRNNNEAKNARKAMRANERYINAHK